MAKNSAKEESASINRNDSIQRNILPIPDRKHVGLTTYDAKDPNTKYPPIEPLRPPKGAPNVLIVLIDDVGFGASSFGRDGALAIAIAASYTMRDTRARSG